MQNLNDDELKVIHEYVKGIAIMKQEIHQVKATVNEVNDRLSIIENVVKEHESDIRKLKQKTV